jgi:hypothetical protein
VRGGRIEEGAAPPLNNPAQSELSLLSLYRLRFRGLPASRDLGATRSRHNFWGFVYVVDGVFPSSFRFLVFWRPLSSIFSSSSLRLCAHGAPFLLCHQSPMVM